MWTRFRDSLIIPRRIVDFRNDKLIWVILYILFFALLLNTRMIIDVLTFDGLGVSDQQAIMSNIADLDPDCGFNNTSYYCDGDTTLAYHDQVMGYYLDGESELDFERYTYQYNIVILDEQIHFVFNDRVIYETRLDQLPVPLTNLDFSLQQDDPDQFEERIISVVDGYLIEYKDMWGSMLIGIDFLTGVLLYMLFILFSAWMLRMRFKQVSYRQMFTMTAYSSTALYLILIFNSLYQLHFLLVILLIFIAFRQNNQLSLEIMRRLGKKKP